jgi:hypothetical protein
MRAMTLGVILTAAVAVVAAQGAGPRIGTWHQNVAKSKYSPGPAPKSQVLKIEAAGEGEKVTSESVSTTGAKTVTVYTASYDAKPYPITGSETSDTVILKRLDPNTSERTDSKGGKVVMTYVRAVSKDGKTMTVTVKGTNAHGQAVHNVIVFEKH